MTSRRASASCSASRFGQSVTCAVATLLVSAMSQVAAAQQPADTTRLDPIVVTATRLPIARSQTAATVTVLDRDELEAHGVTRVLDALRDIAGLDIVETGSFGGATALFVRGGESDYVKVLIDGIPINQPGGAVDLADLTTTNVERIEVVRGPVSVLYGTDAVSGVVQILTRRGRGTPRGELSARAGSFASLDATATLAGGATNVSYSTSVSYARTGGIYPFNNSYRNTVWSGGVRATPDSRTDASLSLRYGQSRFHFPTDGTGVVEDRNALQERRRLEGALEVVRRFTPSLEGRVLLALSDADGGIDDRQDGLADTLGFFGFTSDEAVTRQSADARVNAVLRGFVLSGGIHIEGQKQQSASETQSEYGPTSTRFDAARTNVGYYAQVQSTPLNVMTLSAGVRLDDNDAFGTFVSYRGGASVRFGGGPRIRIAYGRAFKEPTFFEQFADAPFARGNPNLRPERSATWEVGVEQDLADAVRVGATYFDQRFRDLVQYTYQPPMPTDPSYFNVAAANARGLELEASAVLGMGLILRGAYTYLDTRVTDAGFDEGSGATFVSGTRLLRRPAHTMSVRAVQRIAKTATLAGTMRYVGARDDRDFSVFPGAPVVLPSYLTVDLTAEVAVWRRSAARSRVALTGGVRNLFGAVDQQVFGFRTPGRTVSFGMKASL